MSVITAEDIETEQPQSVDDLLQNLPNVEIFSGPRRIGEEANIRGLSDEPIVRQPRGSFPAAEADVWGFYLQNEIKFFKRVSLIPGFGYDRYELDAGGSEESH